MRLLERHPYANGVVVLEIWGSFGGDDVSVTATERALFRAQCGSLLAQGKRVLVHFLHSRICAKAGEELLIAHNIASSLTNGAKLRIALTGGSIDPKLAWVLEERVHVLFHDEDAALEDLNKAA